MRRLVAILFFCAAVCAQDGGDATLAQSFSRGLRQQALRRLEESGESITIMAVGESGLGKTSLMSSLFRTELVWPEPTNGQPTARIVEQTVSFDLEGVPFSARLIDTPGYDPVPGTRGDGGHGIVLGRLAKGFRQMLAQERRIQRRPGWQSPPDQPQQGAVDVVLYFFSPHRVRKADLALLRQLHGRTSIVPVLAKADSMTTDELAAFRSDVTSALQAAKIGIAHAPVAIITASRPAGGEPLGREYPWGIAESESTAPGYTHSELLRLRRFLLIDGLLALKAATQEHYESYRSRALRQRERGLRGLVRSFIHPANMLAVAMLLPRPRRVLKQQALEAWTRARALTPSAGAAVARLPAAIPARLKAVRSSKSDGSKDEGATAAAPEEKKPARRGPLQGLRMRKAPAEEPPPPPPPGLWERFCSLCARLFIHRKAEKSE